MNQTFDYINVMGRPANADAEKTRGRILDSAALLFAEHGVGSTSVRDVAGAANVSLGMVNHYFGSKDGLYDACIEAMFAELGEMKNVLAREIVDAPLSDIFVRAVRTSFRFACSHRTAVRLLVRAAVSTGELYPRGRTLLLEMMDVVSTAASERLARPAADLRLPLQSLVFLVARYAAQSENELLLVVGSTTDKAEALNKVEGHIVQIALELFAIPAGNQPTSKKTKRGAR
jgi:AcrR family transcriptional regulator